MTVEPRESVPRISDSKRITLRPPMMTLAVLLANAIVFHGSRAPLRSSLPSPESPRSMSQGSTGNVIAAVCSFFIPGLGQLVQGRLLAAAIQFVLAGLLWFIFMGWVVHIWSIIDAARYKGPGF
jgi:TM2 domain-containing membrane protein YozV